MSTATGQCLCGAVRIRVAGDLPAGASACHCRMCRVWTGAAQWGIEVAEDRVTVEGPVRAYRSSDFAERAFCETCGTHLWLRDFGAAYEFLPGLFDAAREVTLSREVYADQAFACVALAGDHDRVGKAEYEARHKFVEDRA